MRTHQTIGGVLGLMLAAATGARAMGHQPESAGTPAAQPASAPAGPKPSTPKLVAGKPELARAYVELEELMMERAATLEGALVAEINRGFDSAANSFFLGDYSGAVRRIDVEIEKIRPSAGMRSISLRADPMVVRVGENTPVSVRLCPIYEAKLGEGVRTIGVFHGHAKVGGSSAGRAGTVELDGWPGRSAETTLRVSSEQATRWSLSFFDAKTPGAWCKGSVCYSTSESLDTLRQRLLQSLDGVDAAHPELGAALVACRSRIRLLSDRPSLDNTYLLVGDLLKLSTGATREAGELARGRDPYSDAAGDFWLTLRVGDGETPSRMLVPTTREPRTPRPLIIAVHGAGGDENLWMDGYGGGILKQIAQDKNVLVVTPRVGLGTFMPGFLDGIIEAVAKWHAVDRSRVYVIGHSLGGGIVTAWAKQRPEKIAAACSIAGVGVFTGTREIAPMLAYAGELDGLIAAPRIKRSALAAKAAGLPVEYREVANYGHVLVVGKVARDAVEWLLEHQGMAGEPEAPKPPPK